jgi:hypothetical protein
MRGGGMQIWLLKTPGKRLEDVVHDALKFLLREGVASMRPTDHPAMLLVLDAHWHRTIQLLIKQAE